MIAELRTCHNDWSKKFTGGCNEIKVRLDNCLKEEKKRLLKEMNKELPARRARQEDIIKTAFGKKETFAEFLEKDEEYQRELQKKRAREQAAK